MSGRAAATQLAFEHDDDDVIGAGDTVYMRRPDQNHIESFTDILDQFISSNKLGGSDGAPMMGITLPETPDDDDMYDLATGVLPEVGEAEFYGSGYPEYEVSASSTYFDQMEQIQDTVLAGKPVTLIKFSTNGGAPDDEPEQNVSKNTSMSDVVTAVLPSAIIAAVSAVAMPASGIALSSAAARTTASTLTRAAAMRAAAGAATTAAAAAAARAAMTTAVTNTMKPTARAETSVAVDLERQVEVPEDIGDLFRGVNR
jgi:hypothetical protein